MRDNRQNVEERRAAKKAARRAYKAIRSGILPEDREKFAANMAETLFASAIYRYSGKILAYASFGDEADTLAFCKKALSDGRELYLPKSYPGGLMRFFAVHRFEELTKGAFGFLDPEENAEKEYVPSEQKADLCIVPGVCFDVYGYRIGYGKGYYDRFLTKFTGVTAGLAYDACFCRDALPYEKRYDKAVDFIVTEKGIYKSVRS